MMSETLQEVYCRLLRGYQIIQVERDGNIIQFQIAGYNRVRRSKSKGIYKNANTTIYEVSPQGIKKR